MGTLNNRCCMIIGTQKGTIILTTTHIVAPPFGVGKGAAAWGSGKYGGTSTVKLNYPGLAY